MGLIKSTTLAQVAEAVRQSDPLAHPVVTLAVGSGRHPLLSTLLSCGIADNDTFFVTLTDRSVLFHEVASTGYRPGKLRYDMEREQFHTRIDEVRRRPLWSTFRFRFPGETKTAWLNVRRAWRPEMDRFFEALHRQDSPGRSS
ncbi:hypothetical protein AB0C96_29110 [Streptomyces sp. NPDC048506]|uniref:hypothetical protein n=1 Tax=Streptomyces sp. NPDC048506 TaxID=3155028 RepID=UPI003437B405